MQVERASYTVNTQQAGKADKMTGEMVNIASRDFDAAAAAAILDPQKANDDRYYRVYGKTTAGPYTVTSAQGVRMRIEGMTVDDIGVRPSRLQLPALLATIQAAGAAPPTPAQARELMDKMATIYEGMRIGTAEMRGLSAETPQGPFKLAAIRFNLENGKIGEFALEGLDTRAPTGPVKVGRFALKSLDIANLMRMAALFSNPGQPPSPDGLLGLLPLIEGVEVKGFVAPFKNTGKFVKLDSFDLNWGQFVGPIPSKARLTAKMTTPVDAERSRPCGCSSRPAWTRFRPMAIIGAAWTEAARTFVLDAREVRNRRPPEGVGARFARQRAAAGIFGQPGAGDRRGGANRGRRDRTHGARSGRHRSRGRPICPHPERQPRGRATRRSSKASGSSERQRRPTIPMRWRPCEALARFIESPGQTLTLKLTPRAKVPAMQLFQLLQTDPLIALSQFRIEASTAL